MKQKIIDWVRDWFRRNGPGCNCFIGLSGGKDSTIAAFVCSEALGPDRVYGVAMPDINQGLNEADEIAKYLGIHFVEAPISGLSSEFPCMEVFKKIKLSDQAKTNIPPRLRMTMLYSLSQSMNGRVCGTCNLSEDYLGYFTIFGDGASDFEPFANLTVTELLELADELGIPKKWSRKTPDDGLPCSSPDEIKFGFSYETLDKYIRGQEIPEESIKNKIDRMHKASEFKLKPRESFNND